MKKIGLLLLLSLCLPAAFSAKQPLLTYGGDPVIPTCVALFNATHDNYPYVESVNLKRCQAGDSFLQKTHKNQAGYYYFYKNNKDAKNGAYYYKVIGKTTDGIYVLHTYNSEGKAGKFDTLLLVSLEKGKMPVYDGSARPSRVSTVFANLAGYVMGGDRCTGGIVSATVSGNNLMITQYPRKNSVTQCRGAKAFVIDLHPLSD